MPFRSERQRKFMWANHPKIAHAWAHGRSSKTGRREFSPRRMISAPLSMSTRSSIGVRGGMKIFNIPKL